MRRALEAAALVLAIALLLAGLEACSSAVTVPERASVAVGVACVDRAAAGELEAACPRLRSDVEILALDDYKVLQALRADRAKASACIARLQAAVDACARIPAVASPPPPLSAGGR
jgi:hypothetical protein